MVKITSQIGSILRDRNLYLLGLSSLLVLTLAYQVLFPIRIQVGGVLDRPYAVNFKPPGQDAGTIYRVTRSDSMLVLPGIGGGIARRISILSRLADPARPTRVTIDVQGQTIGDGNAAADWSEDKYIIDSGPAFGAVNWVIHFSTRPADPQKANKPRAIQESRAAVREVLIEPVDRENGAWVTSSPLALNRFVLPGPAQLAALTLSVLTLYVMLVSLQVSRRWSLLAALGLLALFAALMVFERLYLTVFAPTLALFFVASALLVGVCAYLVPRLFRMGGVRVTRAELTPVLLVFFAALVLKFGGTFYPQFISSDLLYQMHRWERILQGNLFFLTSSPEFGNLDIPFAPGYYIFLGPVGAAFQNLYLILKIAAVLFDATIVFFLAFLAFKFTRRPGTVAWIAALVYQLTPIPFLMLSAGNLPNIYSQWLLLALVTVVLGGYEHLSDPRVWLTVVFLYFVAGVSHIGNLIVMTAFLVTFAVVLMIWKPDGNVRRSARALGLAVAAGAVLTFALYYIDFTGLLWQEFIGLLQQKFGGGLRVAGTLAFSKVPVAISTAVIVGGLAGTVVGWKNISPLFQRALLAWFLSAALFVAIAQFAGIYVRYNIYVLPALSLGVGIGCAWLAPRGKWAYAAIALFLAYVIWVGLSFWFVRVMYVYH